MKHSHPLIQPIQDSGGRYGCPQEVPKMANKLVLCIAVLAMGILPPTATATMELYLSDATGSPYQVSILPGESFQVQVGLATLESTTGLSYKLNISDAGSGKFALTDRTLPDGGRFPDATTANTLALAAAAALLDPMNDRDLGAGTIDPSVNEPPGVYPVATLTITAASDIAPGTYVLTCVNTVGTNADFASIPITAHDYTIIVTDGSGGGDTTDPTDNTNADGGTDTTDTSTTDTTTGDQTTGDTQSTDSGTETTSATITSRCGTGVSGITAAATLLGLWLVRPTRRSA
jgi:hypothetical protein